MRLVFIALFAPADTAPSHIEGPKVSASQPRPKKFLAPRIPERISNVLGTSSTQQEYLW